MRELLPNADLFGVLIDPRMASSELQGDGGARRRAAAHCPKATSEREIDAAFATLVQQRAGALTSPFFVTRAHYLITLAARHSVPRCTSGANGSRRAA
jgi:hypothetical protein